MTVRAPSGGDVSRVTEVLGRHGLVTVCREARCPNVGECWGEGTATVLILGDVCSRGCAFCNVTSGKPVPPDLTEPARVAMAAAELRWRHVVVTSVTRDDLADGGAAQFARVVEALRALPSPPAIELLVPDFAGDGNALTTVTRSCPDVLAHNVETVPRLYPEVRPQASYERSLTLLSRAIGMAPGLLLKSGLMVGFGETREEVVAVLEDL
ncbi:MAG: lipoyl synthase, partial [Deltaproteobacteria bacterium]|nr:lipoyl synthase [Deltaproteobacteria bacterium]